MSTYIESNNPLNTASNKWQRLAKWLAISLTNRESFTAYAESLIQLVKPEWRHNKRPAKLTSIKIENKKVYTLTLKPKNTFHFIPGQFVLLSVEINGRMVTRSFSISSAPRDFQETGHIELTIRSQDNGFVTPWLRDHLIPGDFVYLSDPMGDFCLSSNHHKKVFISAGTGITPIRSMLNEHRDSAWLPDAHLFFYLRNKNDRFFTSDLKYLQKKGLNFHPLFTEEDEHFSIEQFKKKITKNGTTPNIKDADYYICGPSEMIASCTSLLKEAGVKSSNINYEYFGNTPIKMAETSHKGDEIIQVDYLNSKKQLKLSSTTVSKTLLELAEEEGLTPTSGCRMGICHQCICKKKQGRVFNTKTQKYSDSGAEDIQLCLSIPVSTVELEL